MTGIRASILLTAVVALGGAAGNQTMPPISQYLMTLKAEIQNPVCYNAPASRTVLLYTLKRTTLALSGATESQIEQAMSGAVATKLLPAAAPDSIAYMMSKEQYIDDNAKAWYPHLMFFMPQADGTNVGESWGADRSHSPVVYDPHGGVFHEPWARFFIPVSHWSDGSPAPLYSGA